MKGSRIIILIIVLICGLIFFLVFFQLTKGIRDLTNLFLDYVQKGKVEKAYQLTSEKFQRSNSLDEFRIFLLDNGLVDFEALALTKSYIAREEKGEFKGKIKTRGGESTPIQLNFIKEKEEWKIIFIGTSKGVLKEREIKEIPKEENLKKIVNDTMVLFAQSIAEKDFLGFYASISKVWQKQINEEELRGAFKGIIEAGIDLSFIEGQDPVFTKEPSIDKYGILSVKGNYTSDSYSEQSEEQGSTEQSEAGSYILSFILKYIFESPEWKLFGIEIDVSKK